MTQEQIWDTLSDQQFTQIILNQQRVSEKWVESPLFLELPRLEDISIPHWRIQPILGKSPEADFWYRLSRGIFNVNMRLRSEDQLHYLEERDLFHDVFGHLGILHDKRYTDYLIALGVFAQFASEEGLQKLSRLYWWTSEFGAVNEDYVTCAYGAGILSSIAEFKHFCSGKATFIPFEIERVGNTPYPTDTFQPYYFVLRDWDQLDEIIKYIWKNWI